MSGFFVIWVAPPLIGAVIGLFTNWLAIKMLFRPLEKVRILGIPIPFTPGILPRERYRISKSMGETVAKELLTEEVLRKRLNDPSIRDGLSVSISGFLGRFLDLSVADQLLSKKKEGDASEIKPTVFTALLAEAFRTLAGSPAFSAALAAAIRKFVEIIGSLPLDTIADASRITSVIDFLADQSEGEGGRKIIETMLRPLYGDRDRGRVKLLPPEVLDPVVRVVAEGLFKACIPVIESFMEEPSTRRQLESQAFAIVRRAVGRLNPLQRIVVTAANYEKTVSEVMPATIEDLARSVSGILRKDDMPSVIAAKASAFLREGAESGSGIGFSHSIPREAAASALDAALAAFREHKAGIALRLVEAYESRKQASLSSMAGDTGLPAKEITEVIAAAISSALGSPQTGKNLIGPLVESFRSVLATRLEGATIGSALGINDETREKLSAGLADRLLALITAEAGNIVAGLDIRKIVVDRIDELDMKDVERMILDVVSQELNWITLLGGVLGGLIGIIQSIIYATGGR